MKGCGIKSMVTFAVITGCALFLLIGLIAFDLLFGPGIFLPFAKPDPVFEIARSRVHIGDQRDNAIQGLSDAWFHTECRIPGSTIINDLFFYGPRNRDDVKIVLVSSEEISNTTLVVFVGGVENYMLHLYEYCTPPPSHAFYEERRSTPTAIP